MTLATYFPHKCIYFPSVKYIPFHKDWDINIIYESDLTKPELQERKTEAQILWLFEHAAYILRSP